MKLRWFPGGAGADVPQVHLTDAAGPKRVRLLGFVRVALEPGESREVTVTADPRLLASFDAVAPRKGNLPGGAR